MPIFDQGYQHWQGTLAGHMWRWLPITWQGVRAQWSKRGTKWAVTSAIVPALGLAGFLIFWGLFEQQSELLTPLLGLMRGLPEEIKKGPKDFRVPIWTFAFFFFLSAQSFFSMILVLLVGPDLISQDLRFNAMPLYFSRPLRRVDYFLGKLGVIGVYVSAVTILPVLLAYGLGVCFSLDAAIVQETAWILAGSLAFGAIVVVSAGTLMLAISSLSKNARLVGGIWVGIWLLGNMSARVLSDTVQAEWCPLVSYVRNLMRLREVLLDIDTAWQPISRLLPRLANSASPSISPYSSPFPWSWSAAVLAGLFGLSLWILSLRVRSLDRLR